MIGACLEILRICFLLQQCLEGTDTVTPSLSATNFFGLFSPVTTSGTISPSQHRFVCVCVCVCVCVVTSVLTTNHNLAHWSELFHQGGGWCQPPGQFASAGLLHLPLSGLLISMVTMWLWRAGKGHFCQELAEEKRQGAQHL
jgi:hypothetical protein